MTLGPKRTTEPERKLKPRPPVNHDARGAADRAGETPPPRHAPRARTPPGAQGGRRGKDGVGRTARGAGGTARGGPCPRTAASPPACSTRPGAAESLLHEGGGARSDARRFCAGCDALLCARRPRFDVYHGKGKSVQRRPSHALLSRREQSRTV